MTGKPPAPVEVTNPEPIAVEVIQAIETDAEATARRVAAAAGVDARILTSAGQRSTSILWETTQQRIALSVVWAALFVVAVLVLSPVIVLLITQNVPEWAVTASVAGMLFLTGVANLVIGFYFGRTNHQRVGSAGDEFIGR